jgi:hypothetical protein
MADYLDGRCPRPLLAREHNRENFLQFLARLEIADLMTGIRHAPLHSDGIVRKRCRGLAVQALPG